MPLNRFVNLCKFKGLFTRREGYPCAGVTLARGLTLALVYKQIAQVGLPYHAGQLYQLCWPVSSCLFDRGKIKESYLSFYKSGRGGGGGVGGGRAIRDILALFNT